MHNEDKPRATQTHVLKANNLDLGHEAEIERLKANDASGPLLHRVNLTAFRRCSTKQRCVRHNTI